MKNARKLQERGFTLIEALVATFVLAFGLLAVITMLDVAYNAGSISRDRTIAMELAQTMLDRIVQESRSRTLPFSADANRLSTYVNGGGVMDTNGGNPASDPALTAFVQWQPLVQQSLPNGQGIVNIGLNDALYANNHRVTVSVSWGALLPRQVTVETVLTRE